MQVSDRVAQPVGMVDAQPVGDPLGDPAQRFGVDGREDLLPLDPYPGEPGDREEPPVVELLVRPAPGDQLVVLPVVHLRRGTATGAGGDRVPVLVVPQLTVHNGQVGRTVVVAEHRDQQPPARPVDVEPVGVRRRRPVAQHAPPGPVLVRVGHPEVVGHDVHDQPESLAPQRRHQPVERWKPADAGVDPGRVHHVVPVLGALRGVQDRRGVQVRDAQVGQVPGEPGRGVHVEVGPHLYPVGRSRDQPVRPFG